MPSTKISSERLELMSRSPRINVMWTVFLSAAGRIMLLYLLLLLPEKLPRRLLKKGGFRCKKPAEVHATMNACAKNTFWSWTLPNWPNWCHPKHHKNFQLCHDITQGRSYTSVLNQVWRPNIVLLYNLRLSALVPWGARDDHMQRSCSIILPWTQMRTFQTLHWWVVTDPRLKVKCSKGTNIYFML